MSKNKANARRLQAKRERKAARRASRAPAIQPGGGGAPNRIDSSPTGARLSSDDTEGLARLRGRIQHDVPIDLSMSAIEGIARQINGESIIFAEHRPDPRARQRVCFYNALQKAEVDSGSTMWGWTFHGAMCIAGPYAWVIHHGIWISPAGEPVDITPFVNDDKNRPMMQDGRVVFLPDPTASPFIADGVLGTLAQRYFTIEQNPDPRLLGAVAHFQREACRRLNDDIARTLPTQAQ